MKKNIFVRLKEMLTPHPLGAGAVFGWVIAVFFLKFLLFDLIWAFDTTFSGFQYPVGYLTKLMFATLLAAPLLAIRRKWYVWTMSIVLDLWLTANLMYFRTYFTVIPASSYGLIGNLNDFQDSVWESLRYADLVFPATTLLLIAELWKTKVRTILRGHIRCLSMALTCLFGIPAVIVSIFLLCKGGYKAAYSDLMYDYSTCGAAVYTIPGAMSYEWIKGNVELTPEVRADIDGWLGALPGKAYAAPRRDSVPGNCIFLLLESFESWPIGKVIEGQEITPNINRLLKEKGTFYAPKMLTQVKGARSIDAQLITHTGLLPVSYGAYSYRFAHNEYPSIDKAWKAVHGPDARSMSFTVDKKVVWNVAIVAQDFGYELHDKADFVLDVRTGPRGRLGDHSLMRQSLGKMNDDAIWNPDGNNFLQIVTYSGHTPFIIPDSLKKVHFSESIPERLRHYLEVANYTDRAVGEFIDEVNGNPRFRNTMIVIHGDHEGLGAERRNYMADPIVGPSIDDDWYTPLIVLNSPVEGRYDGMAGQIDIYPTLLDLLGLGDYPWHGIGRSLFDPQRKAVALHGMKGRIVGETDSLSASESSHLMRAYDISDLIISTNYFRP